MPHIALSAFVIDSTVRWQIDHCSGPGLCACGCDSGRLPHHHHYSFSPIDLPRRRASGLGVPTKKSIFPHLILSPTLSASLPPACSQLSWQRTIRLMFLLRAFMSNAMELCVAAKVGAANPEKDTDTSRSSLFCGHTGTASNFRRMCRKYETELTVRLSRC